VKLSWSSAVAFDAITVAMDGVQVADLPGDATSFTHLLPSPLVERKNVQYQITGMATALDAGAAPIESWPSRVAVSKPRPHRQLVPGATGLPGDQSLRLRGSSTEEVKTEVKLEEAASGLVLQVRARQRDKSATLIGLLAPAAADDGDGGTAGGIPITFLPEPSGARGQWFWGEVVQEVDAGDYILWLRAEGGDHGRTAFHIATDAGSSANSGLQPLVLAYPRSRTELPSVMLRELVLHPATSSLLKSSGEGSGGGAVPGGVRAYQAELADSSAGEAMTPSYSWGSRGLGTFRTDGDTIFSLLGRCLNLRSMTVDVLDRFDSTDSSESDDSSATWMDYSFLSVIGSRPAEGSPPDIEAVSPDPECDGLAFLPDITTDAKVTFRALVTPAVNATIESVRMSLVRTSPSFRAWDVH